MQIPCYNNQALNERNKNAGVAQLVEQLICNQQVGGSSPSTSSNFFIIEYGSVPEWPNGADCKSVAIRFGGSNPPAPTRKKHLRKQVLFSTMCSAYAEHDVHFVREIRTHHITLRLWRKHHCGNSQSFTSALADTSLKTVRVQIHTQNWQNPFSNSFTKKRQPSTEACLFLFALHPLVLLF